MGRPSRFNVRVYGIYIHEGRLLVNEELIRGRHVIKLPGGGLELGEGTREGLTREWKEELGLDIQVLDHFYTTDYFQPSAYDDSQVLSIYYFVTSSQPPDEIVNLIEHERTYWLPLEQLTDLTFTLPIDRIVGGLLRRHYSLGLL